MAAARLGRAAVQQSWEGSERRCRGPSVPSTRVSPPQLSKAPTRPNRSFSRASSGERAERRGIGARGRKNSRGRRGRQGSPEDQSSRRGSAAGRPVQRGARRAPENTTAAPSAGFTAEPQPRPTPRPGPRNRSQRGTRHFSHARKEA